MARVTRYEDYKDRYEHVRFSRTDDGIVTMTMHTEGDSVRWFGVSHDEIAYAFGDVAGDPEVSVLVFTGAGESFVHDFSWNTVAKGEIAPAELMERKAWASYQLIHNMLEIQVPCVAAINGPCPTHGELPIMCDVVVASDDCWFEDGPHFPMGVVPGDGAHIIWPMVVGHNRARYFLTTDMRLSAAEAKDWGAVNEIVPKGEVLDRSMELARLIAKKPPMTRRFTRHLLTQPFRKAIANELSHGLMLEGYALRGFWPKGNLPMTQPWDSADPFER
jgi:enoyl-CoA hydratase/carnithine racemase